jgi:iron uptake system component EfeO
MNRVKANILVLVLTVVFSCGLPPDQQALVDVQTFTKKNLDTLVSASEKLCVAVPMPTANGWDATGTDQASIETMKTQWKAARVAYERIEGSIAVLFPELDESTDQRYDGFLETATDTNLFDDQGVTGIHALERIIWSNAIPPSVVEFEKALGSKFVEAQFPKNETQSKNVKEKLCPKLVSDVTEMRQQYSFVRLDAASAFRGVIGSMREQFEKVSFASTGEEESRYAQSTMLDVKANLEGAQLTYEAFRPWITSQKGSALDAKIMQGFVVLEKAYNETPGDAFPAPPLTWSSVSPSAADKNTPFGKLFLAVQKQTDEAEPESLVKHMLEAATLLGIPELKMK